ncbi:MAG: hypothetical protein LWY06_18405 [Firmicutes bacterium]|nr:hypothetical protein [Bacillota bacterium]
MDNYMNDIFRSPGRAAASSSMHMWGDLPENGPSLHQQTGWQPAGDSRIFTMQNDSPGELISPADSLYLSDKRISSDKNKE